MSKQFLLLFLVFAAGYITTPNIGLFAKETAAEKAAMQRLTKKDQKKITQEKIKQLFGEAEEHKHDITETFRNIRRILKTPAPGFLFRKKMKKRLAKLIGENVVPKIDYKKNYFFKGFIKVIAKYTFLKGASWIKEKDLKNWVQTIHDKDIKRYIDKKQFDDLRRYKDDVNEEIYHITGGASGMILFAPDIFLFYHWVLFHAALKLIIEKFKNEWADNLENMKLVRNYINSPSRNISRSEALKKLAKRTIKKIEKLKEEQDLRFWTGRLNKIDDIPDLTNKMSAMSKIIKQAPKKFFTKSLGKNKRKLRKMVIKLSKTIGAKKRIIFMRDLKDQYTKAHFWAHDFFSLLNLMQENKTLHKKETFFKAILEICKAEISLVIKNISRHGIGEKTKEMDNIKKLIDDKIEDKSLAEQAIKTVENEISVKMFEKLKETDDDDDAANMIEYLDKHPPKFPKTKRFFKWFTRKTYKKEMKVGSHPSSRAIILLKIHQHT
jgi:hypothetical protein